MISFRRLTMYFLWLTVFTMPFMDSFMIPGLGSINRIISIILAVVAVYTVILNQRIKELPRVFYFIFLFFIWITMSYFWAYSPERVLIQLIMYTQLFLLTWIIYEYVDDEKQLLSIFKAYVYGCCVVSFMTINEYLTASGAERGSRFFLEEYNPNNLGQILAFGLPLAFFMIIRGYKRFILYFPIALFMMFILSSRTVLIMFAIILISTIWMLFRYKIRFRKTTLFLLLIAGIFVYNQIPPENLARLSTVGEEISSGTLNNRTIIWDAAFHVIGDRPIFGVGINSFSKAAEPYLGTGGAPHNVYLSIATETGIIGLVLFGTILLHVFYYALKADRNSKMRWLALTILAPWATISLVGHSEGEKFTWILFAIIITMYRLQFSSTSVTNEKRRRIFNLPKVTW